MRPSILALGLSLFLLGAAPAFNPAALADLLARNYLDRHPAPALPASITLDQAYEVQQAYVTAIAQDAERNRVGSGRVAGYKAALTNPAVQKRFGVETPVMGVLLAGMLLPSGARVGANFGSAPLYEGDLLVRVRSAALRSARTHQEVLASLDAVLPFIELPDLIYARDVKVDGPHLVAVNAGARLGIVGTPIPLAAGVDWPVRLATFRLDMLAPDGQVEASGTGDALLGHPLDAVLWLRDALVARGHEPKPGDLLSLGTVTRLVPVTGPRPLRARYTGLDPRGPVEVTAELVEEPHEF